MKNIKIEYLIILISLVTFASIASFLISTEIKSNNSLLLCKEICNSNEETFFMFKEKSRVSNGICMCKDKNDSIKTYLS